MKKNSQSNFIYENLEKDVISDLVLQYGLNEKQAVRIFEEAYLEHNDQEKIRAKAHYLAKIVKYTLDNQNTD